VYYTSPSPYATFSVSSTSISVEFIADNLDVTVTSSTPSNPVLAHSTNGSFYVILRNTYSNPVTASITASPQGKLKIKQINSYLLVYIMINIFVSPFQQTMNQLPWHIMRPFTLIQQLEEEPLLPFQQ
jgi:hypothetical protein